MGFFEILLIAVVTLLVVGPERMPEAVRSVAMTIGRLKRSVNNAREEIERQVGADDIRLQLHNEAIMENLEKIKHNLGSVEQAIEPHEPDDTWQNEEDDLPPAHPAIASSEKKH